jgi:methyl-accepting chemotaxis protein
VRELAEQSQQSTAQVQKILRDIRHATDRAVMATEEGSKGVDAGMLSVQRSGEMMQKLRMVVLETATASHLISAVVKQQFMGLEQVTSAMKDINKVTTQFVNSTQQSKVSSVGISKVADRLRDSISVYKL